MINRMIDKEETIELYNQSICGTKPQCKNCDKSYISYKVEQSINKCDMDCLTFFCCKLKK